MAQLAFSPFAEGPASDGNWVWPASVSAPGAEGLVWTQQINAKPTIPAQTDKNLVPIMVSKPPEKARGEQVFRYATGLETTVVIADNAIEFGASTLGLTRTVQHAVWYLQTFSNAGNFFGRDLGNGDGRIFALLWRFRMVVPAPAAERNILSGVVLTFSGRVANQRACVWNNAVGLLSTAGKIGVTGGVASWAASLRILQHIGATEGQLRKTSLLTSIHGKAGETWFGASGARLRAGHFDHPSVCCRSER
jgi:hypothetical protein